MNRYLLVFLFLSFLSFVSAQSLDSAAVKQDEKTLVSDTSNNKKTKIHSPKKAAWMSAVLPGLGQGYNKKYWKIPIIYVGFAGTSVGIYYYHKEYKIYRDEYRHRLNEETDLLNPDLAGYGTSNISAMKQTYQRNMEIFIIVTAVWYLFNIMDAVVDAHLMSFDVSDNLSLNIMPSVGFNNQFASFKKMPPTTNITFTFNF